MHSRIPGETSLPTLSINFLSTKKTEKGKTKVSVSNPQSLLGWTIHTIDWPMD
jgi:hypothetical protein